MKTIEYPIKNYRHEKKLSCVSFLIFIALFATSLANSYSKDTQNRMVPDTTTFLTGDCDNSVCILPELPSYETLTEYPYLPDPFVFLNGKQVTTMDEWSCRRAEIVALAQKFEFGSKPCTPFSATSGSFSQDTITVTVTVKAKTITFKCPVIYPETGNAPYPAMIGMKYCLLGDTLLSRLGVAVIIFPADEIAQQADADSRGKGKFYDLFGSSQSAGTLMA
jgi:hypothetical protein